MTEDEEARDAAAAKRASKRLSSMSTASSVNGAASEQGQGSRPSLMKQGSSEGHSWAHKFERLVIVRAPPSQLRHPLNLQVQLINTSAAGNHGLQASTASTSSARSSMDLSRTYTEGSFGAVAEASVSGAAVVQQQQRSPAARPTSINMSRTNSSESGTSAAVAPGIMQSEDDDDDDRPVRRDASFGGPGGGNLSRAASVRSNRSTTSLASSTGSGFSTRKVLPCYNLEFHSLQPSVVTDAGTDAKIAKIHKRGVEVLDLAMLDPVFPFQAHSVPPLAAREEARKSAESARATPTNSSTGVVGSGGSLVSDLKPANLLSKFKRFSFRGNTAPNATASSTTESATASPSKESKRSSWLGGGSTATSSSFTASNSNASTSASSSSTPQAVILPVVPLFREKGPNEPGLKGLPDGLNVKITKHAPGYTWLVRHYLRKDLAEAKDVAEISVEWRKKLRRRGRRDGGGRNRDGQQGGGVVVKDLSTARAESRASSRRGSIAQSEQGHGGLPVPVMVIDSSTGRVKSPPREAMNSNAPTTHLQTPSDDTLPTSPTTPTRGSRSVELPRASSVPMEGNSLSANAKMTDNRSGAGEGFVQGLLNPFGSRRTSVDASNSPSGGGGTRAADMLSPNLLGRYRTAPHASTPPSHKHSASTASTASRQDRSTSPASYMMATAAANERNESGSDSGHGPEGGIVEDDDDGEGSDPEDSERPWICELIIKRYSPDNLAHPQQQQRVLLGTLTPAPHHPKLVAHLAIPLTLVPANIGPPSSSFSINSSDPELSSTTEMFSLSIEEMKDLMTVTALWLVVRENLGLGGIHKARKNDGAWRFTTPAALKGGRG